jgi:hypothetical protein
MTMAAALQRTHCCAQAGAHTHHHRTGSGCVESMTTASASRQRGRKEKRDASLTCEARAARPHSRTVTGNGVTINNGCHHQQWLQPAPLVILLGPHRHGRPPRLGEENERERERGVKRPWHVGFMLTQRCWLGSNCHIGQNHPYTVMGPILRWFWGTRCIGITVQG